MVKLTRKVGGITLVNSEIFCLAAKCEIKSTHRRSDFTRRRRISHCEAIFHPPVRVDLVEKPTCKNKSVFLVEAVGKLSSLREAIDPRACARWFSHLHFRRKKKKSRMALFSFWWRRGESNPRPKIPRYNFLRVQDTFKISRAAPRCTGVTVW